MPQVTEVSLGDVGVLVALGEIVVLGAISDVGVLGDADVLAWCLK